MSITSSLNASVAGLNANATKLGTISDNIANSSTFGYKRASTDFNAMVMTSGSGTGRYTAGGVRAMTSRLIDESGALVTTSNPLDLAVAGRGLLPVASESALGKDGATPPMLLTTTGGFRMDESGIIKTETGLVLLGWPANPDGTIPAFPRDTPNGLVPVAVAANQVAADPTTRISLAANLPATETQASASGSALPLSVEYYDSLGRSELLNFLFTPTVPATGASNTWTMQVTDSASAGAVVGEYELVFDDTRGAGGTLVSVTAAAGSPPYDPATGEVELTVAGGPLALQLGMPGTRDGLTQLASEFAPTEISKDGSPVGTLTGVEVDEAGMVKASYDTGFTRTLFQVPLVDVPNLNGLGSLSNQVYKVTAASGPFFMWDAGEGPTGEITGFAREGSTSDIAGELTALIQTQRAYSSNAKVIQTVDEMLQETTNIKR